MRHIVLFRIRDEVADPEVSAAIDTLRALGAESRAEVWHVALSEDSRKGRVIVEDATFESRANYETFRGSAAHREAGEVLAQVADWWVGDYDEPSSSDG